VYEQLEVLRIPELGRLLQLEESRHLLGDHPHATQCLDREGRAWTADPKPLVVPRGDAERGGVVAPAVLIEAERVTLLATAMNERFEPTVERLVCPTR
jgi:hypothetical protein